MILTVKCGVRTHAHFRVPELKSGALDRSANLTAHAGGAQSGVQTQIRLRSFRALSYHVYNITSSLNNKCDPCMIS